MVLFFLPAACTSLYLVIHNQRCSHVFVRYRDVFFWFVYSLWCFICVSPSQVTYLLLILLIFLYQLLHQQAQSVIKVSSHYLTFILISCSCSVLTSPLYFIYCFLCCFYLLIRQHSLRWYEVTQVPLIYI